MFVISSSALNRRRSNCANSDFNLSEPVAIIGLGRFQRLQLLALFFHQEGRGNAPNRLNLSALWDEGVWLAPGSLKTLSKNAARLVEGGGEEGAEKGSRSCRVPRLQMKLARQLVPLKNSSVDASFLEAAHWPQSRPSERAAIIRYAACRDPLRSAFSKASCGLPENQLPDSGLCGKSTGVNFQKSRS